MHSRKKGVSNLKLKKSVSAVVAMAAGTALLVTGCGTSTNNTSNSSNSTSSTSQLTPQKGGTITVALPPQTDLNWYFPLVNSSYDSLYNFQMIDMLYKPLIWIGSNYKINYSSSVADKIQYNNKGTVYHVYLNPKWKWSNGQPVTSSDVLFSWNVIKAISAPNAPAPWPYVNAGVGDIPNGVQSVVANGPYEFTVTLKQPANQQWFIYNGLSQLVPLPAKVLNKYPNNMTQEIKYLGQNGTNPNFDTVVDGPFKLQNAVSNQSWTLVPNTAYSGHKSLVDKLIFTYEGSNAAEFAALKTGTVNVGYIDQSQLGAKSALTSMGDKITPSYSLSFFDEMPNMNSGSKSASIFKHLYVREALMMGEDQQSMNQYIYKGFAESQYGPLPPQPDTAFTSPELLKPLYPFNIEAGKKLLEEHGWHEVNGIMTKNGQQMKFLMIYSGGTTSTDDQVELLKEDWAKEGIDVTLKSMPFSTLESVISNPKDANQWDLAAGQGIIYGGSYPTGGEIFGTGGGLNSGGYSNPEMDTLIKATHQPYPTQQQSIQALFNYENYVAQQLPVIFTDNPASLTVTAANVHDVNTYSNPVTGYPQMNYWWVSSK
ncbi:peptide ABC transporter substrate-binding protein [Alicyclobacillus sp. TC]|nr:peptide ABC transporter substrate-binding protein [Alicyclobacillus sp. TC]